MPTGTAAPPDECAAIQYSKAMQHWERGRGMQNPKGMMQHLLKVQHSNTASRCPTASRARHSITCKSTLQHPCKQCNAEHKREHVTSLPVGGPCLG